MARGVATQSSHAAVERLLPKKRTRTRVAWKPTVAILSEGKEAIAQRWTNTPRAIRPRIERARVPRPKLSKALKAEAAGPNQALARGGSGKVALGPWAGPFGTQAPTEGIPVLYMDRTGSGHLNLEDGGLEGLVGIMGSEEPANACIPAHRHLAIMMPRTPRSQRAHTMEVVALQGKPHPNWGSKANARLPKKGLFHGRVGMIKQPRRSQ